MLDYTVLDGVVLQFEGIEKMEKEHVLKSHKAEQSSFANHLALQLALLQTTMHQYER
jgi:hypothetical protein